MLSYLYISSHILKFRTGRNPAKVFQHCIKKQTNKPTTTTPQKKQTNKPTTHTQRKPKTTPNKAKKRQLQFLQLEIKAM